MPTIAPAITPEGFTTFGELLRYLRLRAQLTQRELAVAVGYSEAQISRLEQNQRHTERLTLTARFVPALGLEHEPVWVARLLELAGAPRVTRPTEGTEAAPVRPALAPPTLPLLTTKLYAPRPRPELVARPRLLAHLDAALHVPLTIVAAPAGFGKTTLIAGWLTHGERRAQNREQNRSTNNDPALHTPLSALRSAWLSLDVGDNDLGVFLRYLVAAVQTVAPAVGTETLTLLSTAQSPDTLVTPLLNDLAQLTFECVLVLDDYHLITSQAAHQALAFLLERLPPQLHLVLATRVDPPLPLARLRARGQLVEIRATELRFTHEECRDLLTMVMRLPLGTREIAALEARTEGWVVGLQLAALSLRGRPAEGAARAVAEFTGSNRFVLDYLVDEVLNRQPAHIQQFLLNTSVLERMCGPLCDVLLGVEDRGSEAASRSSGFGGSYSQLILDELERLNLFLVRLDEERCWYRYHHLFAEVLRQRLAAGANPEHVVELQRRASRWYERNGLLVEAVQQGLAAGDWLRVAGLIERIAETLRCQAKYTTLRGWLDMLPEELVQSNARLCMVRANLAWDLHQLDQAELWLNRAEQAAGQAPALAALVREAAVTRVHLAIARNDLEQAIALAHQALELTLSDENVQRGEILLQLGIATYWSGNLPRGDEYLAAARGLAVGDDQLTLVVMCNQSALAYDRGRLTEAFTTIQAAHQIAVERGFAQAWVMMMVLIKLCVIFYQQHELKQAHACLEQILAHPIRSQRPRISQEYFVWLSRVLQAEGDNTGAFAALTEAEQITRRHNLPARYTGPQLWQQIRLWLAHGRFDEAVAWARNSGLSVNDEPTFLRHYEYLTFARVLIALGHDKASDTYLTEALQLLERWLAFAQTGEQFHCLIKVNILLALAYVARDQQSAALAALEQALVLAEPGGYIRIFLDEGEPLARLLAAWLERQPPTGHGQAVLTAYARRLLALFPVPLPPALPLSPVATPHTSSLTSRELEVLRLLAAGRSNQEIATMMVVAVGTVKRHLNSIFAKLEVQNRLEAVARARELRLLDH